MKKKILALEVQSIPVSRAILNTIIKHTSSCSEISKENQDLLQDYKILNCKEDDCSLTENWFNNVSELLDGIEDYLIFLIKVKTSEEVEIFQCRELVEYEYIKEFFNSLKVEKTDEDMYQVIVSDPEILYKFIKSTQNFYSCSETSLSNKNVLILYSNKKIYKALKCNNLTAIDQLQARLIKETE